MLINQTIPFRKVRKRAPMPPVATGPVLTAAVYDAVGLTVSLTFDRAINIDGLDGSKISVDDQSGGQFYRATGAAMLTDPQTVLIDLEYAADSSGTQVLLSADAGNGIVAAEDGTAWAGVSALVLPFG
jgi:hypothetical protein